MYRCRDEGRTPEPFERVPGVWKPDELPGKRGFDLAHRRYKSRVEPVVADFTTCDLAELGRFDVVLFLGVLYHLQDPFRALKRLAAVTHGLSVVETETVRFTELDDRPLVEFFPTNELADDPSNWWAPNERALVGMLTAAGFARVEIVHASEPVGEAPAVRYRTVAQAWRV